MHPAGRRVRHRHGQRGQCHPLPLGWRLRHGGRAARLHRLHELHLSHRGSRAVRRQASHARHQPAFVGVSDHGSRRVSDRDRLGDIDRRDGPRAAVPARGQTAPARIGRGRLWKRNDRPKCRQGAAAVRRAQRLRPRAHRRALRRVHRRLAAHGPRIRERRRR